ncbi:unnamed protein product [Somion occarium]|uniref:Secreted protein n=1 Tax=Somion occarium TaxID=3059160 RepID=A0ABP1E1Z1_9APHY
MSLLIPLHAGLIALYCELLWANESPTCRARAVTLIRSKRSVCLIRAVSLPHSSVAEREIPVEELPQGHPFNPGWGHCVYGTSGVFVWKSFTVLTSFSVLSC